ncbi:MAG TPA: hypothetical protein VG756_09855 [Pseudonocardiaceae bacterium]|jgi:hypothetical protein|nr:hypothetical protein [Pseudonocardiaceae bacterium]
MQHDDMRAALMYQRATSEADKKIADRLSKMVDQHRTGKKDDEEPDRDDEEPDENGEANPVG